MVGLAVQNAYNEKHPDDKLTYDQILRNYVLVPAGVNNFSATKPENGCANSKDLVAPHIAGSPAGGYWTDTESLNNFGSWLCDKWKDPEFKRLTKEYGQEFYYPKSEMLGHGGSIESSCSYLMAFVDKGIVYAGLSNQPINTHVIAADLEKQVLSHYENEKKANTLSALDLAIADRQIEGLRGDKDPVIKSFAERILPSKNKSDDNKTVAGDLIRSSSFVDIVMSGKSDSSESKVR